MARRMPRRNAKGRFVKGSARKTTRRRRKAKGRATPRRRRRTNPSKPTRRRTRRRRRNPSPSGKDLAMAAVGGAAIVGGRYGLDQVDSVSNKMEGAIVLGGGAVLGVLASFINAGLGAGMLGGGVALGGYQLLTTMLAEAKQKEEQAALSAVYGPALAYHGYPELGATQAHLSAVQANLRGLGAVQADLDAIEAGLY